MGFMDHRLGHCVGDQGGSRPSPVAARSSGDCATEGCRPRGPKAAFAKWRPKAAHRMNKLAEDVGSEGEPCQFLRKVPVFPEVLADEHLKCLKAATDGVPGLHQHFGVAASTSAYSSRR